MVEFGQVLGVGDERDEPVAALGGFADVDELRWTGPGERFAELAASFDAAISDRGTGRQ